MGLSKELEKDFEDNAEAFVEEAEDCGEMPSQEESGGNENMFVLRDQIATEM